jgi:hypothetical protein
LRESLPLLTNEIFPYGDRHKVIAGRARDLEDIQSILLKNPAFDAAYVEECLAEFDAALSGEFLPAFRALIGKLKPT